MDNDINSPVFVTKPTLPPLNKFVSLLENIWKSRSLSNFGDFHSEFKKKLISYLDVDQVNLFVNGTLALETSLQALGLTGEIITTPFTFVATSHAIYFNQCTPVYCDIDPNTLCIDADKIESLITPKTTAIVPVHVYGIPCDIDRIKEIADNYGLKVIYDSAHAFGVNYKGKSLFNYGDISIASFHATKIFNTFEGGALFSHDKKLNELIYYLKNFGFMGESKIVMPGHNAKFNEFQAALGILQLEEIDKCIVDSKKIFNRYFDGLSDIEGITFVNPLSMKDVEWNYSYCPILIDESKLGNGRDEVYSTLAKKDVYARKYFYPLVSNLVCYRDLPSANNENLAVANMISKKVLCLPLYPDLSSSIQNYIIEIIRSCQK